LAESIRNEKDPQIRRGSPTRFWGGYPGPEAEAIWKAALADPEAFVREAACESWGKLAMRRLVMLLSDVFTERCRFDVRMAAAKALGQTKKPEAAKPLSEALADTDPACNIEPCCSLEK